MAIIGAGPPGRSKDRARRGRSLGFTVIELLAATGIIGLLTAIAVPKINDAINEAKIARAIGDIHAIELDLAGLDSLPPTLDAIGRAGLLDPWGAPYVYYKFPAAHGHAPPAGARKDRFLVPLNSTYDLYSLGADGQSQAPLTAKASRDDVVRANDGGYIGLASKF